MQITTQNYQKLLARVQQRISQTKANIVKVVDRQKVVMSWEIGKEIEEHLKGKDKANYGEEFFRQLSKDTTIAKTALYQMRAFYKHYPKLPSEKLALSWSHYRNLIAVKDAEDRRQLEQLVIEKNLGSNRLQKEIAKRKKQKKKPNKAKKLKVTRGNVFNYKISGSDEIDLGFNIWCQAPMVPGTKITAGEIVTTEKHGEEYSFKKSTAKSSEIHCYKAFLERVVDGDTIHVMLDLGFKIKHREILRLSQINAPEMKTKEGKKSAAILKKILKDAPFLIVKTNKTDIYGRYVADVFFEWCQAPKEPGTEESDPQKIADEGTYLSQLLLDLDLVEVWG